MIYNSFQYFMYLNFHLKFYYLRRVDIMTTAATAHPDHQHIALRNDPKKVAVASMIGTSQLKKPKILI